MNAFHFTTIAHAGRGWLGPVSPASFATVLDLLPSSPSRVLDVGCGKGAMLAEVLVRFPDAVAVGVEPNPDFAKAARDWLVTRAVSTRATLLVQPLERVTLPRRAFELVLCVGATHAFGTTVDAVAGAARLATPGGAIVVGDGHWRQPPAKGYLELLGCGVDAHASLADTIALGTNMGLEHLGSHESTLAEWDEYEGGYAANVRAWAEANHDDGRATAYRERIERWADGRVRWGRDTLGFALHLYRVPENA